MTNIKTVTRYMKDVSRVAGDRMRKITDTLSNTLDASANATLTFIVNE